MEATSSPVVMFFGLLFTMALAVAFLFFVAAWACRIPDGKPKTKAAGFLAAFAALLIAALLISLCTDGLGKIADRVGRTQGTHAP